MLRGKEIESTGKKKSSKYCTVSFLFIYLFFIFYRLAVLPQPGLGVDPRVSAAPELCHAQPLFAFLAKFPPPPKSCLSGTAHGRLTRAPLTFQIDIVNKIFVQNLDNPPLYKNHPPVAGAICWERSLFYRIKHTILRFQEVEELLDSERGQEVCHCLRRLRCAPLAGWLPPRLASGMP